MAHVPVIMPDSGKGIFTNVLHIDMLAEHRRMWYDDSYKVHVSSEFT